ncbi:MAG: glycosyltransferase family 4 protein, partial [Bacteroidales bacterium]|nr:glycosyltransferase family 4 protein [Bacteroidales bacterium]
MKKQKIFISYLSLIHYRKSVFELLLNNKEIDVHFGVGKINPIPNMKNFESNSKNIHFCKNININFKNNVFTFQLGMLKNILKVKPDIVILLGVNPLIVSSLLIFLFLKLFTKTKILWWGHGTLGNQGVIGKKLRLFFYKKSDGIILYAKSAIKDLKNNIKKSIPIYVLGNAINTEDYGYLVYNDLIEKKTKTENQTIKIIFSGRITKRKNLDLLIKAVLKIKLETKIPIKLNIVGNGSEKSELEKLVIENQLVNEVFFLGELYGIDIHNLFFENDIYALPSHAGLSVIHANSFGLPIITSNDFENHPPEVEFISDSVNGSFYIANSVDSLSEEILVWHKKILADKNTVVNNCINSAIKYSPDIMYNKFLE